MQVKLIANTTNLLDILYTSARTCYSSSTSNNIYKKTDFTDENKRRL